MFEKLMHFLFPSHKVTGEKVSSLGSKKYEGYLLNDPTTPDLVEEVPMPKVGMLKFNVRNMSQDPSNEKQRQALNCFITLGNCINYVQGKVKSPIRKWATVQSLKVVPVAGKMLNAFYNRKSLRFFYETDPVTKSTVYTANSTDIVAHELGHALLDAMRNDFWNTQALEVWSFHEAFADITAITSIMMYDKVLKKALKETDGDLRKSNVISRLAEEVGQTIYNMTGGERGHNKESLRDAVHVFKYKNPKRLPRQAPHDKLASECHSFGRVFLSAWYEILVRIHGHEMKKGKPALTALRSARDAAFTLFVRSVPTVPKTPRCYEAAAKIMVALSEKKGKIYHQITKQVFTEWGIIQPKIKVLSDKTRPDVLKNNDNGYILQDSLTSSALITRRMKIKLNDHVPEGMVSALSVGSYDLADLEVEIPADSYYEFDANGNVVDEIEPNMDDIVDNVRACAVQIQQEDTFAPNNTKMWRVEDGRLIRNFIS